MKNHHKYFRNIRYKEKLDGKGSSEWKTYWSHVMYFTEQVDPKDLREHTAVIYKRAARLGSIEAAIDEYIRYEKYNDKFIYYSKPEVPYSVTKVHTKSNYSGRRVEYQKYSNKRIRQAWKQKGEVYQHCQYKKIFGIAWELD